MEEFKVSQAIEHFMHPILLVAKENVREIEVSDTLVEALTVLEVCDIVYEPPAMVLGYEGKHTLPPKYLVPITHVAYAYEKLPSFMSLCKNFKD